MPDLNQGKANPRDKIIQFMNELIELGVAGFRIDAAKHMYPADLDAMFSRLNNLSTNVFPMNTRPFIYQEVIDLGGEAVKKCVIITIILPIDSILCYILLFYIHSSSEFIILINSYHMILLPFKEIMTDDITCMITFTYINDKILSLSFEV